MHEYNEPLKWWRIRNPVTGEIVTGGKISELLVFCWAIAEGASKITGDEEHYGYSSSVVVKELFDLAQNYILVNFRNDEDPIVITFNINDRSFDVKITGKEFNGYMTAVLSLLSNEWAPPNDNLYDWLVRLYNDTEGILGMPDNVGVYPYLPLIAEVLYGYNGAERWPASLIETDFLNNSPPCGAHHYVYELNGEEHHEVTDPPWHTVSLGSPQHNKGDWKYDGEYNMIDYMLLYSAYFKDYLYGDHLPYQLDEAEYPFEEYEIIWDINGYPDTIWHTYHTCSEPRIMYASRQIDSKAVINEYGGVHYIAGNSVRFLPGFKVNTGGCLTAHVDPSLLQDFYYHKTNVNTCTGGNFKGSAYAPSQIDSLISLSRLSGNNNRHNSQINFRQATTQKNDTDLNREKNEYTNTSRINNKSEIKVYPNPSYGIFNVYLGNSFKGTNSITIIDSFGKCIFKQKNVKGQLIVIEISNMKKGIYYLTVHSDQKLKTLKLVLL